MERQGRHERRGKREKRESVKKEDDRVAEKRKREKTEVLGFGFSKQRKIAR